MNVLRTLKRKQLVANHPRHPALPKYNKKFLYQQNFQCRIWGGCPKDGRGWLISLLHHAYRYAQASPCQVPMSADMLPRLRVRSPCGSLPFPNNIMLRLRFRLGMSLDCVRLQDGEQLVGRKTRSL